MGRLPSEASVDYGPYLDDSADFSGRADVQTFILIHLVTKLGTAANDAATSLKLLEKGLKKEDLALAVLIDFPFQIWFGYLAAKWSKGEKPLRPVSHLVSLSAEAELTTYVCSGSAPCGPVSFGRQSRCS